MPLASMHDLLLHELKDLYHAEKQLTKALPQMAKAASHPKLKQAFEAHLLQTHEHVSRLEKALELIGAAPRGAACDAMEGLVAEGKKIIAEDAADSVRDAALVAAAQRIEHYELAAYGCARAFAESLDKDGVVRLLTMTLEEESATNESLTQLAESTLNPLALQEAPEESDARTPARPRKR